jgi:cytoskeletal protein RodZ
MYEQNQIPVFRRILWIVLWFIVAIAIIWALAWLVFFRHPTKVAAPSSRHTSQGKSPVTKPNTKAPSSSAQNGPTMSPATPTPTSAPAQSPDQLVNTGAGNVLVPFVVTSVVGSTFYYIRTRKRLLS